jgi:hypothetical protein
VDRHASSGSGIGLNAMIFAAKSMAGAVYDLLVDNRIVEEAKAEFQKDARRRPIRVSIRRINAVFVS